MTDIKVNDKTVPGQLESKMEKSAHTQSSNSHFLFKKKLSLHTCWSSVSIEKSSADLLRNKFKKERGFFIKFLDSEHKSQNQMGVLAKMKICYEETEVKERQQKQLSLTRILISSPTHYGHSAEFLPYFMALWLDRMGYRSEDNKKRFFNLVRLHLPMEHIHVAMKFYENFGMEYLQSWEQWDLMEKTCKNGWEYLAYQVIEKLVGLKVSDQRRQTF